MKPLLKTFFIKFLPAVFWKGRMKSYYFGKLKLYAQSDEVAEGERDLEVVRHIVQPGDTVFDVGANFGYHTLFLSKFVGDQGEVYSVEPIPLTFEILSNGVRKLPLMNVRLFNCGISDKEGSGIMEIPTYDSGGENFYQARIIKDKKSEPSFRDCEVVLKTLDSFLPSIKKSIDFIKIDVEGHELQAIMGANQLIERFRPPMLIEVSGDPDQIGTPASELFNLLSRNGYSPYWYKGAALIERNHGDKSINYFFLTNEQFRDIFARMTAK